MNETDYYREWYANHFDELVEMYGYRNKEVVGQYESVDEYIADNEDDFLDFCEEQYDEYKRDMVS